MRLGYLVIFISYILNDNSPIIGILMIELDFKMQLISLGLFFSLYIYEILMTKFCLGIY